MAEREITEVGKVTHYFTKIGVAIVELTDSVSIGDRILLQGPNTDFEQVIESMQIEHKNVATAQSGQSIGLKTRERVRETDTVYKIVQ